MLLTVEIEHLKTLMERMMMLMMIRIMSMSSLPCFPWLLQQLAAPWLLLDGLRQLRLKGIISPQALLALSLTRYVPWLGLGRGRIDGWLVTDGYQQ